MKRLALFDFDGTITKRDTLLGFLKFVFGWTGLLRGLVTLSPLLISYALKKISNHHAKEKLLGYFFAGWSEQKFNEVCRDYSLHHIDSLVRPQARERLAYHKNNDDRIIVVSASLENWLKPWCEKNGLEVIGTQMLVRDGILTGQFATPNCYGEEKVNRVLEFLSEKNYATIFAYGDSQGDIAMLNFANESWMGWEKMKSR